jgi:hypothetical protein
MSQSSVVIGTVRVRSQSYRSKRPLFATASTHSVESDEKIVSSLIRISRRALGCSECLLHQREVGVVAKHRLEHLGAFELRLYRDDQRTELPKDPHPVADVRADVEAELSG